jgi:hypothetical protein
MAWYWRHSLSLQDKAVNKKTPPRKKRPFYQKLFRFFAILFLALILLIVLVFAGMLIYFTPQRIENIAEDQVQKQLNRSLDFEAAHISLLNGFVFKNISLPPKPDSTLQKDDIPLYSFYAKELSLRYSLRHLLRRQVIITSALIDSPRIELRVLPVEKDSLKQDEEKPQQPDSLAAMNSPIALNLNSFRLRNAQITVDIPDSMSNQHIFLSDISCSLLDVAAPNGDLQQQQDKIRGHFNVECDNSIFKFSQRTPIQTLDLEGALDAKMDIIAKSLQYIKLQGFVNISNTIATIPDMLHIDTGKLELPIRAEIEGVLNPVKGDVHLPHVALFVDDVSWADLNVRVQNFLSQPTILAQIQRSRIPVEQLIRMAAAVAPDSLMPEIYLHDADAFLSLAGTEITGTIPDTLGGRLNCLAKLHLRNFGVTLNHGEYLLQNLNFTSTAKLAIGLNSVHSPELVASIDIDSLAASLPDNSKVFAGTTSLNLSAKLDDDLLPSSVTGDFSVANLIGADLNGDFTLGASSSLANLNGKGSINLVNFDPSKIAPLPVQTTVAAKVDLKLNGLENIHMDVSVDTDSLHFQQEELQLDFAPILLKSDMQASTNPKFQDFRLKKVTASLNDFLSLQANATAQIGKEIKAVFNVPNVTLAHEALLAYLPEELKTAITGLNISGSTSLTANGRASIAKADTTFHVKTTIKTQDLDVDYMELITLNGVNVAIGAEIDSDKSGTLVFDLLIDSTKTSNLPQSVFYNNHFGLAASISDFAKITVDSGVINLPDLKTNGTISAKAELIGATPIISADINLHQSADDTIYITQDILYSGQNNFDISVRSDTAKAHLSANIKTIDLTVSLPNNISIDRINSDISIEQAFDIRKSMLISDGGGLIKTPTGGLLDYSLYRDYYSNSKNRKSIIKVRKITAMDYVVENAHVEAYIGNSRLDVPYLTLDLYGGNIGGAFSLAANVKDLMDSPYKLSAHFSGINSALLLPTQQEMNEQGLVTAHTELTGRGFDIERGIELDGYFYITKIESKVADNLLRSLDPENKDSGIRNTRRLINLGFKPELFSFEIRHGYSYPAVSFDQPWYFPVRLSGGGIELGRIPIAFFLQQQK